MKEKETIATSHSSDHPSDYPSFEPLTQFTQRAAGCSEVSRRVQNTEHPRGDPPSQPGSSAHQRAEHLCAQVQDVKVDVRIDNIIRHSELNIQCSDALLHGREGEP